MPSASLDDWLRRLETAHPQAIDLGLERVATVWRRLGAPRPAPLCIVVGGTNGKGSTVALVEAMLRAAGHRVGAYTSPHLLRYNERLRIDGIDVEDARWVAAFERIESARAEISLTYFEFGTLAAFLICAEAALDAAVLEIGLGGRLDAVNLIDGDVAILTSVDLDHQAWLGDTREAIGWEKAHIFRAGKPAVIALPDPPESVLRYARDLGAIGLPVRISGDHGDAGFDLALPDGLLRLPRPVLAAGCQVRNAAAAVLALWAVRKAWRYSVAALQAGVTAARVTGRLQRLARAPETWVDVAHNPEAARVLAQWLGSARARPSVAVFAALADKDLEGIVEPLRECFSAWLTLDLRPQSPRARSDLELADALRALLPAAVSVRAVGDIQHALAAADEQAGPDGRVLVFGSFLTVAAALAAG